MINTVEKLYGYLENNFIGYRVTYSNGEMLQVPHDEANRHYQEILEWVADGNTITDNGGA